MACNCADEVDAKLEQHNTRLERAMMFDKTGRENNADLMLRTYQIETGRGKPKAKAMFISYCPFCGVKYDSDPSPILSQQEKAA